MSEQEFWEYVERISRVAHVPISEAIETVAAMFPPEVGNE